MSHKQKKLQKTVWVFKPCTMARLNANAHSLGSLSGPDQPWQYHIVLKRSFVLFVLSHLSHCLFSICITLFIFLLHLLSICIVLFVILLNLSFFLPLVLSPKPVIQNESVLGNYFSLIVLIYAPACKDICQMDFLSASSKEPNGISPGPSSDLASSPHLLLLNKGQHSDWLKISPLQTIISASCFVLDDK